MKIIKIFLVALCFATLISHIQASSIEVSGSVSGHWIVDTVKVMGDISLDFGQSLLIDPGVRVEFKGYFQLMVSGRVIAQGMPDAMIEFARSDTTGFSDTLSNAGGWKGIFYEHLDPDTDSSLFSYCVFRYGKAWTTGDSIGLYGGAFRIIEFDKISFSNCLFENNYANRWGGAIYARNANIFIEACTFRHNRSGTLELPWGYGGAVCFVHSSPQVISTLFDHNTSTGIGGGASFEHSDPVVMYNIFQGNYSGLGGGIGYLRSESQNPCSNNLVYDNEARFFGGGIACIRSHTVFVNNTVTDNFSVYGGGFYCNDSACPSNYNCLFYNNYAAEGVEVYIWDIRSAPNFYFCNVPGDTSGFAGSGGHEGYHGEYWNNLDTVPEFSGSGSYPYQLLASSPMKDSGTPDTSSLGVPEKDLAGNTRIYNHRIDIGAYEWNPAPGITEPLSACKKMLLYPNPAKGEITIKFLLDSPSIAGFAVFTMEGRRIYESERKHYPAGWNEIHWEITTSLKGGISPGSYFLRLESEGYQTDEIFLLMK